MTVQANARVGKNFIYAHALGKRLWKVFEGASVLDLGAGLGQYPAYWVRARVNQLP